MIEFVIPAIPVAQPRARARVVDGHAQMYQADSKHPIHTFKAVVKLAYKQQVGGAPLVGPLRMEAEFVFPRIKFAKKLGTGAMRHAKKPDVDNIIKGLADALNKLAYEDDGQICECHVFKFYAAVGEAPHVRVRITPLDIASARGAA